jgi:hypothetical protein
VTWVDPGTPFDWDDTPGPEPPEVIVVETDNPTVAVLYGPDGEPLIVFKERSSVPFGYQPPPMEDE